jgi:hypothetical protein
LNLDLSLIFFPSNGIFSGIINRGDSLRWSFFLKQRVDNIRRYDNTFSSSLCPASAVKSVTWGGNEAKSSVLSSSTDSSPFPEVTSSSFVPGASSLPASATVPV